MYDVAWAERVFTLYCNSNPRAREKMKDLLKSLGPLGNNLTVYDLGHEFINSIARRTDKYLWTEFKKLCQSTNINEEGHFLRLADRLRELLYKRVEEKANYVLDFEK